MRPLLYKRAGLLYWRSFIMKKNIKKIITCFFVTLIMFLFGLVASDTYNFYNADYEIVFSVNEDFDYKKIENKEYLLSVINVLDDKEKEKYESIDINKMIDKADLRANVLTFLFILIE